MPSPDAITAPQLARLIGTPDAPTVLDARTGEDPAADPRLLPRAVRRGWQAASARDAEYAGLTVAFVCQRGLRISQGIAAYLTASHPALLAEA